MKRKLLIGVGIFVSVFILLIASFFISDKEEIILDSTGIIEISFPAILSVKNKPLERKELESSTDVVHHFSIKLFGMDAGYYELVERELGNGTSFLFERIKSDTWVSLPVKSTYILGSSILSETSWNPEKIDHPHHPDFGVDPTVNPWGVVKSDKLQLVKGHVFLSTVATSKYSDGEQSILRVLDKEIRDVSVGADRIEQSFWVKPGLIAESWALVSTEALFVSEDAQKEWIDYALNNQASQLNWLTVDGPYTKLPYSIEPGTKMGYGRAMGRFEDDIALRWYEKDGSLFHESMALNSRVNLLSYIEEYGGTRWPTEYTSMWLKNAYGIHAPYVDTRFNEYVAFYLDKLPTIFNEEIDGESLYVPVYADYLLSRVEKGDIIMAKDDSYLIVDYFDDRVDTAITHASLNHELGGLKILLSAYDTTGDRKYLEAANKVIKGIETFGQDDGGWIRENGDLWYQAKPDGSFSGDDYPQLTLLDLLETQIMLEEMGMTRNFYFDEMIDSKMAFLESENVELIEKVTDLLE